jgi:toxin ParE1/3/4
MKITFSSVFEADFAGLIAYFASEVSPELSVRFENRMIQAVELIAGTPEIGRRRKELQPGDLRSFRVEGFDRYLIFYQVRADDVLFIRVLHGAMDLPSQF